MEVHRRDNVGEQKRQQNMKQKYSETPLMHTLLTLIAFALENYLIRFIEIFIKTFRFVRLSLGSPPPRFDFPKFGMHFEHFFCHFCL